ncbi:hypothetical protein SAMN04488511_106264 [Pedobacter suwonensis]|uniref:Uncharacterized protein n=1 Tax=Pedobacter suwonensis TaxID=332999 RepID=A0A1I0T726_9SPHI|nr:hypothetical protein SAMN04488511_106264 [Pedobacter suwonensis]
MFDYTTKKQSHSFFEWLLYYTTIANGHTLSKGKPLRLTNHLSKEIYFRLPGVIYKM